MASWHEDRDQARALAVELAGQTSVPEMLIAQLELRIERMEARLVAEVSGLRLDNTRLRLENAQLSGELDVYRRLAVRAERPGELR